MTCRCVAFLLLLVSSVLSTAWAQPIVPCCKDAEKSSQTNGQDLLHAQPPESKPALPFVVDTLSFRTMDPFMVFKTTQGYEFGGSLQAYVNFTGNGSATITPPFGSRLTLPLSQGRLELFGATAGLIPPYANGYVRRSSWTTETQAGVRIALDRDKRYWVGATGHYLVNFADRTRQWVYPTADFTVRLGH